MDLIEDKHSDDPNVSWWAHERTLTALITVTSLALLYLIVQLFFPTGQGLVTDRPGASGEPRADAAANRRVDLSSAAAPGVTARIDRVRRNVRVKAAGDLAWDVASVGHTLGERDAIQTLANSRATLHLGDGGYLVLDEKSMLVLESNERDPLLGRPQATMVMMAGQLSGSLSDAALGIRIPNSSIHLHPDGDVDELEFRLAVNDDKTTNVDILAGSATVMSGDRRVRVTANQGVLISADGLDFDVAELPPAPVVVAPATAARIGFRGLRPSIDFRWRPVSAADGYRVTIAADPKFERLISSAPTDSPRFTHANLGAGRYYWRVTTLRDGRQSRYSDTRTLWVVEDRRPPGLTVQAPDKVVTADRITLRGSTDRGARVFIGGKPVTLSDNGDFEYVIRLDAGANRIIVESVDQVGNVSYASYTVIAKPTARMDPS